MFEPLVACVNVALVKVFSGNFAFYCSEPYLPLKLVINPDSGSGTKQLLLHVSKHHITVFCSVVKVPFHCIKMSLK